VARSPGPIRGATRLLHRDDLKEANVGDNMVRISRSSILQWVVVAILLTALPGAVHTIIQTHDPYLFTRQFFEDILARLSGPGRLRFILQPVVAIFLGSRDGMKDARLGHAPFLWVLLFHRNRRSDAFRSAINSLRNLVALAILMDVIAQILIFRQVRPGAALLVGPVLIGVPYGLARAFANRLARRMGRSSEIRAS
jgi:hypothetical protein